MENIKPREGDPLHTSPTTNELASALSKAQGELKGAKKDSVNPHFRASYSDLESTWDACREPLSKHGLSVVQMPYSTGDGRIGVTTRLMHSSGEWIEGNIDVMMAQVTNPQNAGSLLTYLRRYSLQGAVGINSTDDDANAASGNKVVQNVGTSKQVQTATEAGYTPTKPVGDAPPQMYVPPPVPQRPRGPADDPKNYGPLPTGDTPPPEEPKKDLHTLQNELYQLAEIARDAGRYKNEGEAVFAWTSYRDKKSGEVKGFKSVTSLKHEWQVTGAIDRAKEDLNAKVPSDPSDPEWIK